MKVIAILIAVFNNLDYTKKCLKTLEDLVMGPGRNGNRYQIVVTDDGSTDGTGEWLANTIPAIHVVKGDGSLWWSGGINEAAKYAISELQADFLLLWNNDIQPAKDYFVELDKVILNLPERTIAGSKIFQLNKEQVIWSFGGVFNPKSGMKYMVGSGLQDSPEYAKSIEVDWLPGMGTLVPAIAIQEIGLWDAELFPQYHGDSDFTFRAKSSGYNIIAYPQLKLWNDKSSSGITHGGTLKGLYLTLTDIRSGSQLKKNFLFYKRHATSILAYRHPMNHSLRLVGGFFKWKILALFGKKRNPLHD